METLAKTNNPFRRVQLNAAMEDATFGDWGGTVANLSAALPNSRGTPLDWWVRGNTAGGIGAGIRKANSPNLITVSVLQPTDGSGVDNGALFTAYGSSISYTDGPTGAGTSTGIHRLNEPGDLDGSSVAQNWAGGGFRIVVPAQQWPDWYLLKVWTHDTPRRRTHYKASLNNAQTSTDELWIDYYASPQLSIEVAPDEYDKWALMPWITTEVRFAADEAGRSLTYDITRTFAYGCGIAAVALYRGLPTPVLGFGT